VHRDHTIDFVDWVSDCVEGYVRWDGLHEDVWGGFDYMLADATTRNGKLTKGESRGEDDAGDDEGDSWVEV
jgi:hypothetical protein